ncbi:MAG: Rv3654c family TadE-like protein [Actinomycetota bacterium]
MTRREDGAISILIATGSLLMMLLALAAADLGSMLLTRARAQTAADAAALAAVVQQAPVLGQGDDPEGAAREAAERNGATLLSCECEVGTTEATVSVEIVPKLVFLEGWFGRRVRATARAEVDADVLTYEGES